MAKNDTTDKATRTRRSPGQRAADDMRKAQDAYDRAEKNLMSARDAVNRYEAEVNRAKRYLDYAKANPDLPAEPVVEADSNAAG